jgi:hypothetical protein
MNDNRPPRDKQPDLHPEGKEKKLYQKPAFRYERVFETQALSCSKVAVTSGTCQAGAQKTS